MCLAVHRGSGSSGWRLDEAEHLALGLVHPVAQVVDVVRALRLQVRLVCVGNVVSADAAVDRVHIHVERHVRSPPWVRFRSPNARSGETCKTEVRVPMLASVGTQICTYIAATSTPSAARAIRAAERRELTFIFDSTEDT